MGGLTPLHWGRLSTFSISNLDSGKVEMHYTMKFVVVCCLIKLHQFFRDFGLGGSFQKESGFSAHYQLPIILVSEGPEQKKISIAQF